MPNKPNNFFIKLGLFALFFSLIFIKSLKAEEFQDSIPSIKKPSYTCVPTNGFRVSLADSECLVDPSGFTTYAEGVRTTRPITIENYRIVSNTETYVQTCALIGWDRWGRNGIVKNQCASFNKTFNGYGSSCDNPDYPVMSQDGDRCFGSFFKVSDSELEEFEEKKQAITDEFVEITDLKTDIDDSISFDGFKDDLLDMTAQSSVDNSSVKSNNDIVSNLASLNPNNLSLAELVVKSDLLTIETQSDFDNMFSQVESAFTQASDTEALINQANQIYGFIQEGTEYYYGEGEKLYTVSSQTGADIINNNLQIKSEEIQNLNNDYQNIVSEIKQNTTNIYNSSESIDNSSTTIHNNLSESNTILNQSTNSSNNGETCVAGSCVPNPSVGEDTEEEDSSVTQTALKDVPSGESFYTSVYENGFSGVFDEKLSILKSTSFFTSMSNFTFTGSGSPPTWSFNVWLFGAVDFTVPSNIWAFIRIVFLITTGFVCRRIIFGG